MTANILQRLEWIERQRNVLAAEDDGRATASGRLFGEAEKDHN